LFDKNSFKNVIVTGTIAGNDGRKLSKSYGNYTDPNEVMDTYSADSLRFLLLSSTLLNGEDFTLTDKDVGDVARKLSMVWNMYDFFTLYADVDGWGWEGKLDDPSEGLSNVLDKWIVSRVHQLTKEVDMHMQQYDIPNALEPVLPFLDDASNWYVRRSRKRFWKSEDSGDKRDAYKTLHYVLVQLAQVLAPFTPFLSEELYQKLTGGESVHLLDWPEVGHINELLLGEMERARGYISDGLAMRANAGIKVRQPLASVTVPELPEIYKDIIAEELNVKEVKSGAELALDTNLTAELNREGLMREIIRQVQNSRKAAGLQVDDRIALVLHSSDKELQAAVHEHADTIKQETLANHLTQEGAGSYESTVKIESAELTIKLSKN
jgi:isoleucyl-tRNA synthetase